MVVPAANQALATIRKAMDELIQLNEGDAKRKAKAKSEESEPKPEGWKRG